MIDYIQNIKGGGTIDLNEYISQVTGLNSSYDLYNLICNLQDINAELRVRPYKRDIIKDWNVLDDFYSLISNLYPYAIARLLISFLVRNK